MTIDAPSEVATLTIQVANLQERVDAQAALIDQLESRMTSELGQRALVDQERDALSAQLDDAVQFGAALVAGKALRSTAHRETSASISAWQDETFGPATTTYDRVVRSCRVMRVALLRIRHADLTIPRPNLSRAIRAAEELAELITLLVNDDADPKAPEECADVDIVLRGIDRFHGVERASTVDAKMAKNRARTWQVSGDGHGQHVEGEP